MPTDDEKRFQYANWRWGTVSIHQLAMRNTFNMPTGDQEQFQYANWRLETVSLCQLAMRNGFNMPYWLYGAVVILPRDLMECHCGTTTERCDRHLWAHVNRWDQVLRSSQYKFPVRGTIAIKLTMQNTQFKTTFLRFNNNKRFIYLHNITWKQKYGIIYNYG